MSNSREPRPLPRPVRWVAMFMAFVFVISLGVIITHVNRSDAGRQDRSSSSDAGTKAGDTGSRRGSGGYRGLQAAGIPVPGDWSRQSLVSATRTGGESSDVGQAPVGGRGGPVDVALDTVDAILDPTPSDEEWNQTMQNLFQPDIAGASHGQGNMARYWWRQRRFNADKLCTGVSKDMLLIQSYDCSTDHRFQGKSEETIKDTQYWDPASAFFDVPQSIGEHVTSSTDPQTVISRYYDAVAIPMDDGVWYVTVDCPAMADQPFLDKNGDEMQGRLRGRHAGRDEILDIIGLERGRGHQSETMPARRDHRRRSDAVLVHRHGRERLTCPSEVPAVRAPACSAAARCPSSPCCASC